MTIIIKCVFSEDGKLYPQLFLDDTSYEKIDVSEGIDVNKTTASK